MILTMGTDHFTPLAAQYKSFRPAYPDELFDWLASIAPQRKLAWDCGAGNGQATIPLASRFELVLGTDISAAQLASAQSLANVEYRVMPAETSGLPDHSADIVTVAQALHWFDLPKFYAEVRRVLKPQGIIAAWGYNRLQIDHAGLQQVLDRFYDETIGAYWPPERVHVENNYQDLAFPFTRISLRHLPCTRNGRANTCSAICAVGRQLGSSRQRMVSTLSANSPMRSAHTGRKAKLTGSNGRCSCMSAAWIKACEAIDIY